MKIPLRFENGRILLKAIFYAEHYHSPVGIIDFIVDTGSDMTTLSFREVLNYKLPFNSLDFKSHSKIGGQVFEEKSVKQVRLSIQDYEGELQRFYLEEFYASVPTKIKNQNAVEEAKQIPSIIGMDFLREQKLALYCDPGRDLAYLEK